MMLDKVKLALRKTAAVFDDEIEDYITSGIADPVSYTHLDVYKRQY